MSTLLFSIGIAVTFLTVWGVIMVCSYLLGDGGADAPATVVGDRLTPSTDLADGDVRG